MLKFIRWLFKSYLSNKRKALEIKLIEIDESIFRIKRVNLTYFVEIKGYSFWYNAYDEKENTAFFKTRSEAEQFIKEMIYYINNDMDHPIVKSNIRNLSRHFDT